MSPAKARIPTYYFNRHFVKYEIASIITKKENEIQELLSQVLFYKEVAYKSVITLGILKQPDHNIYQNLNIQKNRNH